MRVHVELIIEQGDHWAEGSTVNLAFVNGATLELGWSHSGEIVPVGQIVPVDYFFDPSRMVVPVLSGPEDEQQGVEVAEAEHVEAVPPPPLES
jgi:hypothetical protein